LMSAILRSSPWTAGRLECCGNEGRYELFVEPGKC